MVEKGPSDGQEKAQGFFASIGASVRDHLDERLKSPFGGAFALAWLIVNWRELLILAFSSEKVEARVAGFSKDTSLYDALWHPLWLALTIAVAFYLLSALFIGISELYQWLSRSIKRPFDHVTWVHPDTYVKLKREHSAQVSYYVEAASDNLDRLRGEQKKTTEVTEQLVKIQTELSETIAALNAKGVELSTLKGAHDLAHSVWTETEKSFARLTQQLSAFESETQLIAANAQSLMRAAQRTGLRNDQEAWNELVLLNARANKILLALDLPGVEGVWSNVEISEDAVSDFLSSVYPSLPVDRVLLSKVLGDMKRSRATAQITTLGQLRAVMRAANDATNNFASSRPDLFANSVDYLSKALGFVFPDFRGVHSFSAQTRKAFDSLGHLVQPLRANDAT